MLLVTCQNVIQFLQQEVNNMFGIIKSYIKSEASEERAIHRRIMKCVAELNKASYWFDEDLVNFIVDDDWTEWDLSWGQFVGSMPLLVLSVDSAPKLILRYRDPKHPPLLELTFGQISTRDLSTIREEAKESVDVVLLH